MKPFYERNDFILNHEVNVNFEELLDMTPEKFEEWVVAMRKAIVESWDTHGNPPRTGKNEQDIITQWNKMAEFPVHQFTHSDELSDVGDDVIVNNLWRSPLISGTARHQVHVDHGINSTSTSLSRRANVGGSMTIEEGLVDPPCFR